MCHQSVGLLQGAIERRGIPTISVTVRPEITAHSNISRACYLRFPTGNPMGEPHKADQQRMLLTALLDEADPNEEFDKHLLVVANLQRNTTNGLLGTLDTDLHDDLTRLSDRV